MITAKNDVTGHKIPRDPFKQIPETAPIPPIQFDDPEEEIERNEQQQSQHGDKHITKRQQETPPPITKQYPWRMRRPLHEWCKY